MAWLPKTIWFGRSGRIHLDSLRDPTGLLSNPGNIENLHESSLRPRQRLSGPVGWGLLVVATAALVLVWVL